MTRLTRPAVLLLLFVCLSSAEDEATDIVEVYYAEETITAGSGSSVKLSCEARYDFKRCEGLRAAWNKQGIELRDPRKYFTTVNETVRKDNMRSRQIVTEILNLQQDDVGDYQCNAKCDKEGEAVGRFISIDVRATDIVEVYYTKGMISAARGSSVKLSCEARYDFKRCDGLHVAWNKQGIELTDPGKYLTSVINTVMKDNMRSKQIVTEIFNLQPEDRGAYQCNAECDKGGDAMGHFISIDVQGK